MNTPRAAVDENDAERNDAVMLTFLCAQLI